MATIKQLIDEANRVIAETQQGGNTQLRIGNLYLGIIDFLDVIDKRTAEGYEYDDTALKEAIAKIDEAIALLDKSIEEAVALATQERDRLDNLINELDSDIADKVNSMMGDAAWLEEHARGIREVVNEGEIYWQSGWNANIEAYLQEVGVWARDGEVIKTQWSQIKQDVASIQSTVAEVQTDLAGRPTSTQWSQITQKVTSIEQSVNKLLYNGEFTEALQASINQSIDDNIAALSLETTYAKKDVEGAEKILEWMYSAFKNASSQEMTYAQMVSAGKSGINNGVSEVRTYVNAIRDGDFLKYEAVSSIEAKVDDVITGLYNKATAEDAKTTIFSQVKKDSSDIATIVTHCTKDYSSASIATKFDNFVAGIVFQSDQERALASLAATLRDDINTSTAGLVAEATMEAAFASMTSQFNNKLAGFIAKTDLEEAFVTMIAEDEDNGAVAQIFARANESGSEIRLSADKITMTNAFADSITANTAFINFLKGGSAEFAGKITASEGYIGGWEITEDTIRHETGRVGLYSGSEYSSEYVDSAVRFWAGGSTRDTAPFRVTHAGSLYAEKGTIGGFTIGNNYIGSTSDYNEENLYLSRSFVKFGGSKAYVLLGSDVAPGTAGGSFTMSMRIYNHKTDEYSPYFDPANYGIYIDVGDGTKNYGIFSTAAIRASAMYSDKVKTLDLSSSTYNIDLSQYNVYMLKRSTTTDYRCILPNESSICRQFSYSSLPYDSSKGIYFGVRFSLICPTQAGAHKITIADIYNNDGDKVDWDMTDGDVLELLCTNYGGTFKYMMVNVHQ